jgi:alpha-mannosidase
MFHDIRLTSTKINRRLRLIEPLVYRRRQSLSPFRHLKLESPLVGPPVSPEVDDGDWQSIPWGSYWCEPHADFVLRTRFQIPPDWNADSPIALHLPIGKAGDFSHPEALAYIDGVPYAACDRHHQEILLPHSRPSVPPNPGGEVRPSNTQYPISIFDGASHLLALHGWAGSLNNDRYARLLMRECALVQVDQPTRDFVALARVALGVADHLDENEPARAHLYTALDEAFKALDTREPFGERFYASVPAAHETLREGVAQAGAPLDVSITAVGHAHIDVAWLWTLGQTRRKCGRTFYNVVRLMEQFPEFCFSQSQPQLYDFVRQDYPALFEVIKQQVREGRWELLGGTWVEADCNITGPESLARQFLLGRTFFRNHFGADADAPVLWLPDVFGYAWNLPQLIKEAGLEYFFTIKLGWNQYNRLPYDSFWWQGLDGTRILTHFSTTFGSGDVHVSTYNANASPEQTLQTWRNFQQKDWGKPGVTPPLLMSFGYGDGGGGPTREMVENIREMGCFPATPQIKCGQVGEFFRKLEAEVGDRLPTWNSELYLENHRGTYTTQSRNKRANRQSEFLLHDAEFLATLASVLDMGHRYPHAELHRAWELVCLNQFHDILPGSSIGPVYVESQQQYAEVREIGERVRDCALAAMAEKLDGDALVVNPTSFKRRDLVFWSNPPVESPALQRTDGSPVSIQSVEGGLLLDVGELLPYSITPLLLAAPITDHGSRITNLAATPAFLENNYLRVELDTAGDITRIYDKLNGRDVLPAGATANQFQAFEDRPINPDAWDIDIFYDDKPWLAEPADSVRVVESGPLRATIEVRRRILNSEYIQRISLVHNSPRLDFDTTIQWRERHILLKVAFPVEVLSPQATYEIQWGNVQRPTHRNTSWDWARFEVCAQKWVDLSEGGYGVSLLNDCKYGHDIRDNVMRLSLLRSPTMPDPEADQGQHRFVYSLLPHEGGWDERTIAEAYALNDPLIVWTKDEGRMTKALSFVIRPSSFVSVNLPNVVIETIKQAEDGQGVIVRLYESQRHRGQFTLTTAFPLAETWRTNLLEENQERLEIADHQLRFSIKPYQIVTLRLLPKDMATHIPVG